MRKKTRQSPAPSPLSKPKSRMREAAERFTDPFLLDAGTSVGNHYRIKRAIIRLEQEDLENQATIRALRNENEKLRMMVKRLHQQAGYTERMEKRFEQLSSILMDANFFDDEYEEEEEEEEEKKTKE